MASHAYFITGANSGIGFTTAQGLLAKKCASKIYLGVRSQQKGEDTIRRLKEESDTEGVEFEVAVMDLGDLRTVQEFTTQFLAAKPEKTIDVLILNAGVMGLDRILTPQGLESHWQINHVAHHLLATRLLERVKERVISLASSAHQAAPEGGIRFEDPNYTEEGSYGRFEAYGQSKMANIMFARELARREPRLFTAAVHPGVVQTNLFTSFPSWMRGLMYLFSPIAGFFLKTADDGALTTLHVATAPLSELETGKYWADEAITALSRKELIDVPDLDARLWQVTEKQLSDKL